MNFEVSSLSEPEILSNSMSILLNFRESKKKLISLLVNANEVRIIVILHHDYRLIIHDFHDLSNYPGNDVIVTIVMFQ